MNTKQKILSNINDKDIVQKVSFGELQAWAIQFPYVTTFKIWLAEKAVLINHPSQDEFIEKAALISQNRSFLQQKIELRQHQYKQKTAKEVQALPASIDDEPSEGERATTVILEIPKISKDELEERAFFHDVSPDSETLNELATDAKAIELPNIDSFEVFYDNLETITDITQGKDIPPTEFEALDLTQAFQEVDEFGFEVGDEDYEGDVLDLFEDIYESESDDNFELDLYEKPTENTGLVSETLAQILTKQGHIEKAKQMYQRLRLLFPEKDAYFATIIENLNKENHA